MKAKLLALREISILRQHGFLRHYNAIENNRYEKEYKQSITKPELFWSEKASLLEWFKKPINVLDMSNPPFSKWFVDGELNAAYNCLDLHVINGFGSQTAIIHDSPLTSSTAKVTFQNLKDEVWL
jgi:propionyl-CoA synthetase